MIGRCPTRDSEIADAVIRGLEDEDINVQMVAMRVSAESVKACPDRGDRIASALLELCNRVHENVVAIPLEQLVEAASVWPARMDEVVEVVLRESSSSRYEDAQRNEYHGKSSTCMSSQR